MLYLGMLYNHMTDKPSIPPKRSHKISLAFDKTIRDHGGDCGWYRSRLESGEVFVPEYVDGRRLADKVIRNTVSRPPLSLEVIKEQTQRICADALRFSM